jgi:hypothetical protein
VFRSRATRILFPTEDGILHIIISSTMRELSIVLVNGYDVGKKWLKRETNFISIQYRDFKVR